MKIFSLVVLITALSLAGCKKKDVIDSNWTYQISKVKHSFLANYMLASEQHLASLQDLRDDTWTMANLPYISNFNKAKNAWLFSYRDFILIKPYFLMHGDIANPFAYNESRIDLSSVNPAFLDYTAADPNSGIIADEAGYPNLDNNTMSGLHNPAASQLTLGYHVVEFMLWGEDLSLTGTGSRSHLDYVTGSANVLRRRQVLAASVQNLHIDMTKTLFTTAFENDVLAADGKEFLKYLLNGLLDFIENDFAERTLLLPYNSQNMDDELSQFSDNTFNDIESKIDAIDYMLNGNENINASEDYYLGNLFAEIDEGMYSQIQSALSAARAITSNNDFDAVISSAERTIIKDLYDNITQIGQLIRSYATTLEIAID